MKGVEMNEEDSQMEDEIVEEPPACRVCGGELYVLGALGKRMWFRCQNCGMEFSSRQEVS
jgi:tRNA(Ile2) C34 agmatinyltransferase TiaS